MLLEIVLLFKIYFFVAAYENASCRLMVVHNASKTFLGSFESIIYFTSASPWIYPLGSMGVDNETPCATKMNHEMSLLFFGQLLLIKEF